MTRRWTAIGAPRSHVAEHAAGRVSCSCGAWSAPVRDLAAGRAEHVRHVADLAAAQGGAS